MSVSAEVLYRDRKKLKKVIMIEIPEEGLTLGVDLYDDDMEDHPSLWFERNPPNIPDEIKQKHPEVEKEGIKRWHIQHKGGKPGKKEPLMVLAYKFDVEF